MSNQICIIPTEFVNVKDGSKTFGYRVYDNYGSAYNNGLESIPDDDLEILLMVRQDDNEIISDMISFLVEEKRGLYIGDQYYEYEEIKHVL